MLANVSHDLADSAHVQAQTVNDLSSSIDDASNLITKSSEHMAEAASISDVIRTNAQESNEKMKEMRKPECREGKERNQDMRKINRTVPIAISVKRKASAGWINATTCSRRSRKRRRKPVRTALTGNIPHASATAF